MASAVGSLTRMLVVDDDVRLLRSLAFAMSRRAQVLTAHEPAVAIELARRHQLDVVIVDLCIGEHRGVDLVVAMRATLPDATIVVLSGFVSAEMTVPGADLVI